MILNLIVAWTGCGAGLGISAGILRRQPPHKHDRARSILRWTFVAWLYLGITALVAWEVH